MPILLPLTAVLIVVTAIVSPSGPLRVIWVIAAATAAVLIIFTLAINVPINKRTQSWDAAHPPENWQQERTR